jgi:hypothetical protein
MFIKGLGAKIVAHGLPHRRIWRHFFTTTQIVETDQFAPQFPTVPLNSDEQLLTKTISSLSHRGPKSLQAMNPMLKFQSFQQPNRPTFGSSS